MEDRLRAKIISGIVMFFSILVCFLLPIKLHVFFQNKGDRGKYYLDLLTCYAGGVFLAVYLIFMAPAVRDLVLANLMVPNQISYPLPDVLIGAGFFIMLLLNRIVVSLSHLKKKKQKKKKEILNISSSRNSELLYIPSSELGPTNPVVMDNQGLEDLDYIPNPNNPYPLARQSSITDVAHQDSSIRSIVMMLALSLDSVFEGVTTGLKTTTVEVWAIFIGNMVHETIIAFCLGLQLIKARGGQRLPVVIAALMYSLMNPLGLIVASIFYETKGSGPTLDLVSGLLQGLTSGCFIYVTFCEILEGQLTHETSYAKIFSLIGGFTTLALFATVPGSSSYELEQGLYNCTEFV